MTPPLPPSDRTKQFNVRLSPDEIEEVRGWAEMLGMTASDFVRHAVRMQIEPLEEALGTDPDRSFLLDGAHRMLKLKTSDIERVQGAAKKMKKKR